MLTPGGKEEKSENSQARSSSSTAAQREDRVSESSAADDAAACDAEEIVARVAHCKREIVDQVGIVTAVVILGRACAVGFRELQVYRPVIDDRFTVRCRPQAHLATSISSTAWPQSLSFRRVIQLANTRTTSVFLDLPQGLYKEGWSEFCGASWRLKLAESNAHR